MVISKQVSPKTLLIALCKLLMMKVHKMHQRFYMLKPRIMIQMKTSLSSNNNFKKVKRLRSQSELWFMFLVKLLLVFASLTEYRLSKSFLTLIWCRQKNGIPIFHINFLRKHVLRESLSTKFTILPRTPMFYQLKKLR